MATQRGNNPKSANSDSNVALGSGTRSDMEPMRSAAPDRLSAETAREKEAQYRGGVDISLKELADKFTADGYDAHEALQLCGYSDEQISEEVTNIKEPDRIQPDEEQADGSAPVVEFQGTTPPKDAEEV
jgi:hypothetical protein